MKDNIILVIGGFFAIVLIYLFGSYYFGLVADLYHLLHEFLWSPFAGIISIITALVVTSLIIQLSIISVTFIGVIIFHIIGSISSILNRIN